MHHLRCESGELLLSIEYLPRMVMVMFSLFSGMASITFLFLYHKIEQTVPVAGYAPTKDIRLNKEMG